MSNRWRCLEFSGRRFPTTGAEVHEILKRGERDNVVSVPLPLRLDLRDHSPTGFEWGYGGSGPSQLALAVLVEVTGDEGYACARYMDFTDGIIASLPFAGWSLSAETVTEWVRVHPATVEEKFYALPVRHQKETADRQAVEATPCSFCGGVCTLETTRFPANYAARSVCLECGNEVAVISEE